jgi:hypothetical protein
MKSGRGDLATNAEDERRVKGVEKDQKSASRFALRAAPEPTGLTKTFGLGC